MIVALTHIWSGVSSHAPDARIDLSAHRQGSTNPILVAPFLQYRRLHAHPLRVRCRRLPARSRKHLHYNSFLVILSAADSYRLGVRTESCRDRNRPALRPPWPTDLQTHSRSARRRKPAPTTPDARKSPSARDTSGEHSATALKPAVSLTGWFLNCVRLWEYRPRGMVLSRASQFKLSM
jgi:hypothetical protein